MAIVHRVAFLRNCRLVDRCVAHDNAPRQEFAILDAEPIWLY